MKRLKVCGFIGIAVVVSLVGSSCGGDESGGSICDVAADFTDIDPTEGDLLQDLLDGIEGDPPEEIADDVAFLREAADLFLAGDSLEVNFDRFYEAENNIVAYGEQNC